MSVGPSEPEAMTQLKPAIGTVITGLTGRSYTLIKELMPGKNACSFLAEPVNHDDGQTVFIKIPYVDPTLGIARADERLNSIERGFRREYQQRDRLMGLPHVALVLDAANVVVKDPASEHEFIAPCLVQQYVAGVMLEEYLREKYPNEFDDFSGIPNQEDWFSLARAILLVAQSIHNRSIVHGDIWPPNILLVGSEPYLVDFGQSFIVADAFHEFGGTVRTHPYLAPERFEATDSWYSPADIYALGGVLFFLASGTHPDGFSTLSDKELQSCIHTTIKRRNPKLLKENMGIAKVIDKCMRHDTSDRYPYVDSVLEALDIFDYALVASEPQRSASLASGVQELTAIVNRLETSANPLFADLARSEISFLRMRLESMSAGNYEILGHREELINSLLRYLSVLGIGDTYMTVTVPSFWSEKNLGVNGRFLTMNKMMALRGVTVLRVFMLCESDRGDPQVERVLAAHLDAAREVAEQGVAIRYPVVRSVRSPSDARLYYTGFIVVPDEERQVRVGRGDHVAIWKKKDSRDTMAISFSSRPDTQEIGKVRFSSSPRLREVVSEFERDVARARPLEEFLGESFVQK